ncbi:hypothetical protein NVP1069O_18 [Vibrio phage 1.069.O._10N.286.49.F11]|uniref:Uncharacterized protein n=7 Tax=Autolykiviridae TaxID=2184034 RepID=A0A2I7S847_9VIRU|nr:hypothetical protein KMD65_gp13 [Vibrio phage 1.008.O._10N.286.54.E5]AUR81646.1 hypothetical protein NVP1011O_17 [Vibrio phage 1.011.O._10N.286.49.B11]AUR83785.1 hypothetical protein NVP1040O_18 [Vibrio phage 1.040.O._10N.286.45.B9]AUR84664.1 hypothetical protein NVP1062O_18 [Vibrio phage 1.062.O._10N.286.55.C3]AUR85161.1 hypothetical protein NVP1069O_18 [Vibrio phage 1.069.O._10N.286.49.F11]AUR89589.1 hypothetical protein NVP1125O_18 [Vibrio phage 1.125.O._10N.286.49.F5]AUS02078.1 hypothe
MSLIRDYDLNIESNATKSFATTGTMIAVRRGDDPIRVRVKAYTKEGGTLVTDSVLSAGEKVRTGEEFNFIEITNYELTKRLVRVTLGDGDFQSDVVEGEVVVRSDTDNPLQVISKRAPRDVLSAFITHQKGTDTPVTSPDGTIKFSAQNLTGGDIYIFIGNAYIYLAPTQLFSTDIAQDTRIKVAGISEGGQISMFWVIEG